jgi:hypothetical protein
MNRVMQPPELEAWVLSIADRVARKQPVEDSRVELKSAWPTDAVRAARRLAGHCNAARGEPALWVVGIDETDGVVGASHNDLAAWWPAVRKHFEALAPELVQDINIPVDDKTVVALLFNTNRAPFVVANPFYGQPGGGHVAAEVPWRDGTSIRSARREDLLRLLVPIQHLPIVEPLSASLVCTRRNPQPDQPSHHLDWQLIVELYVTSATRARLIIPYHRCTAQFSIAPFLSGIALHSITLRPRVRPLMLGPEPVFPTDPRLSRTVDASISEVIIDDAGLVILRAHCTTEKLDERALTRSAMYTLSLGPADVDRRVSLNGELAPPTEDFSAGGAGIPPSVCWGQTDFLVG